MQQNDFLPREYVEHRDDRRTHTLGLALFGIVVAAVALAFLAKQSDWQRVSDIRDRVTSNYELAGEQVAVIVALEEKQRKIHERARIAASLVERLPRSTVLSEFINRMPAGLGLLEFDLHTHVMQATTPESATVGRSSRADRSPEPEPVQLEAVRYRTDIALLGFAPTDLQVSEFLAELNAHPLLEQVVLQFSEETDMDGVSVRQFRMTCSLGSNADIRAVEPRRADGRAAGRVAHVEGNE